MNREEIIKLLMEFDFERVHKAMVALNWNYHIGGAYRVPDIVEIRELAVRNLRSLDSDKCVSCESGGFKAELREQGDGIQLSFIVESQHTWTE